MVWFLFTAVACPMLLDPLNGVITYAVDTTAPFNYQTTATYSCNTGYGLSSISAVRICGNTEEWSGTAPTCNRKKHLFIIITT